MMNRFFTLLFAATCLTAVGQVPDYVPTDGLMAWCPLDGSVHDHSGYYQNPFQQGGQYVENRFTEIGKALYFNGLDDYSSLDGAFDEDEFSISLWALIDSETKGSMVHIGNNGVTDIQSLESDGCDGFGIGVGSNSQLFAGTNLVGHFACVSWYPQSVEVTEGVWQHVVVTFDGITLKSYLDGELMNDEEASPFIDPSPSLYLGTLGPISNANFEGALDDIGVWDRVLSSEEVQALLNAPGPLEGCIDEGACNFDLEAVLDDGSCHFNCQFCLTGTVWSEELGGCIGDGSGDINLDGCVQLNDLLDLLSAYGDCGAEETPWLCGDPLDYQGYDYATVQIGDQCWFAENLRSLNYSNDDEIPSGLTAEDWQMTNSGATALIDVDAFGRLYNWYAVDDIRGICPTGWGVPTDEEWKAMEASLGMDVALTDQTGWRGVDQGNQMKATTGWGNGTNASGFAGLPGGYRGADGVTGSNGTSAYWWSSSPSGANAWIRHLRNDESRIYRNGNDSLATGFSVRCLRDAE